MVLLLGFGAQGWLNLRRALVCTAAFLVGCSFYFYMPVAASTNPPMNWGYAATKQGFLHAITRGQYERMNFSWPWQPAFWIQIRLFRQALMHQYSTPLCLVGLVTLVLLGWRWRGIRSRARSWLIFVWAAFFTTSFGLLTIINPRLDKQNQEINLKFFAPAHGFFAMLIGYGAALLIAAALVRWKTLPRNAVRVGCVLLFALPIIPFKRNWATCEQRGHDFGYQFGYRMFYPGGDYPPMDRDAVLFGGTDPGRFVPTYMIFCESRVRPQDRFRDPHLDPQGGANFDRRDVYIITQNALADNTYMSYIRDHYDYSRPNPTNQATLASRFLPWQQAVFRFAWKYMHRDTMYPREPIYIPSENDLQRGFQEYVQGVQARQKSGQQPGPDEQVQVDAAGRVSVRGVGGVMAINGILTKWIFDRNKDKHAFYVEESYVIPWMYAYMTPYGIILKINHDPLPAPAQVPELWAQIVARDRAYWDKLCADFEARPEFRRDSDAQKTFSKLRSAIGGLYTYHHMTGPAEYAFRQALALCPESPEANFRLAQLYIEQNRVDDALDVLRALQKRDPLNRKIGDAINQLQNMKQLRGDVQQLEQAHASCAPRRESGPAACPDLLQIRTRRQNHPVVRQLPRPNQSRRQRHDTNRADLRVVEPARAGRGDAADDCQPVSSRQPGVLCARADPFRSRQSGRGPRCARKSHSTDTSPSRPGQERRPAQQHPRQSALPETCRPMFTRTACQRALDSEKFFPTSNNRK